MAKVPKIARRVWPHIARMGHASRIQKAVTQGKRHLNLGCQTNIISGWLNVDIMPFPGAIYMDASKPWPIPPESLDAILCEHMIEHVPKSAAKFVLREAAKSLRPGSPIRLVTPNLNSFAQMALSPSGERAEKYQAFYQSRNPGTASICDVVNSIFYEYGHRYIFSVEELRTLLLEVGFKDIVESRPGTAIASVFIDKEGHPALLGEDVNAIEAFAVEAIKI